MFKEFITENSFIKDATAVIQKNGYVMFKDNVGIEIMIDEISAGWAYGVDQFDGEIEIDLTQKRHGYSIVEGTGTGDIAQSTVTMSMYKKKLEKDEDLDESPVGARGRTDAKSALAHLTPELKKRFRKLLKDVGGKTVLRALLANAPDVPQE